MGICSYKNKDPIINNIIIHPDPIINNIIIHPDSIIIPKYKELNQSPPYRFNKICINEQSQSPPINIKKYNINQIINLDEYHYNKYMK